MKEWYIRVHRAAEGPFSIEDLLRDPRVDEKTFAWRRGMAAWMPIEQIPELAPLFKKPKSRPKFKIFSDSQENGGGGEGILTLTQDPFNFYLLIAILLIIIAYSIYEIFY